MIIVGPSKVQMSDSNAVQSDFYFEPGIEFIEWSVRIVPSETSTINEGIEIGTANGSTNMHGTNQGATRIQCSINSLDLEAITSSDGLKIVKVFVKDTNSDWR